MNDNLLIAAFAAIVLFLLPSKGAKAKDLDSPENVDFRGMLDLPRGIRNNNPGNLKYSSSNRWRGKIEPPTALPFEQFENVYFGIRAMLVLLNNYRNMGIDTVEKIINRYAPPTENNTSAYIFEISDRLGVLPGAKISKTIIPNLAHEMARIENGEDYQLPLIWFKKIAQNEL